MIEFYLGKTGGGKSYLALVEIAQFLAEYVEGYVVTNLSLKLGDLNAYLKETYPHLEPDVVGRVRILTDAETRFFYLHRENGNDIAPTSLEEQKRLVFPEFEAASNRSHHTLYVIDEAHIYFDAREWANVGPALNFFASQHRKFRCDIIFITQFLDQVEKRLRNHATQFRECQNFGLRKWAFWKLPSVFMVRLTYKAPPCPSENTVTHRINVKLANCYDTTAGVGVKGGRAPERVRRKGWPFWTLPAAACVVGVAVAYLPDLFATKLLDRVGSAGTASLAGHAPAAPKPSETKPASPAAVLPVQTANAMPVVERQSLVVVGYVVRGGMATLVLSDGRTLTEKDPEFGGLDKRGTGAWVDGRKIYMARPVYRAPVPPAPVVSLPEAVPAPISEYKGEALPLISDEAASPTIGRAGGSLGLPQAPNKGSGVSGAGPRSGPPR